MDLINGLSASLVERKLAQDGPNTLNTIKEVKALTVLLRQFANFFIILLLVAAVISYFANGWFDAIILIVIILLNVSIGFFQEYKAEKSLEALKRGFAFRCRVIRDGKIIEINSEEIVTGDVVVLGEGDRVPADIRLIEEEGLRINESALTGESLPVSKKTGVLPLSVPLGDRKNMAFGGSNVVVGRGRGVVVATGCNTELGIIATLVEKKEEDSPLEKNIIYVAKIFSIVATAIALCIFLFGLYNGWHLLEITSFVIAVLVAAVPESLPTATTLALAVGVIGMVKHKAIVRKLGVIESLGRINIIATDKTGTITKNELSLAKISFFKDKKLYEKDLEDSNEEAIKAVTDSLLASNVSGHKEEEFIGDPLEVALANYLAQNNFKEYRALSKYQRLSEIPFSSDKKFNSVVVSDGKNKLLITKGAPEKIVEFCYLLKNEKKDILAEAHRLSSLGFRAIAVAEKKIKLNGASDLKQMEFLAILAFADAPANGVGKALEETAKLGIRPVIITGDHPETAKYIAEKIGWDIASDEIVSGEEFEKLNDRELRSKLERVKIFARITPQDKLKIVELMEKVGYVVAVTGDGVNDAPALKAGTVGIAMGQRGTDVAREAADIILSDDNYSTIINAVTYGRVIYDNIKNAMTFLIAGNFAEIMLIAIATLLGLPSPLTALQILWINLITDSFPSIAISLEGPSYHRVYDKPRDSKKDSIKNSVKLSLYSGIILLLFCIILFIWGLYDSIAHARTLVFFAMGWSQMALALSIRSKKRIWQDAKKFFGSRSLNIGVTAALLVQFIALYPSIRHLFGLELLDLKEIAAIVITVLLVLLSSELLRFYRDKKRASFADKIVLTSLTSR